MEDNTCSHSICKFKKYKQYQECILHCPKEKITFLYNPYFEDAEKFCNHLIEEILNQIFITHQETETINKISLRNYLMANETSKKPTEYKEFIQQKKIVFTQIIFPNKDESQFNDYSLILNKLGKIHFNYCHFYPSWLNMENVECFFQNCEFFETWFLKDYAILENINKVLYQECIFHKNVSMSAHTHIRCKLSYTQFNGCSFENDLIFENVDVEQPIFKDWNGFTSKIKYLKIDNCKLEERFVLKNYEIETADFVSTIFKNKFEFEQNIVNKCEIYNCNFEKTVDFYLSKIEEFNLRKSIFEGYTGFENCQFGYKHPENNHNEVANFSYVTFMSFVNFRNTYFFGGLNLDSINVKEPPNFLNIDVDPTNTTKETFRLIKYSFDKIGNHTDANKFFAFEMKKYKEDLYQYQDKKAEKFIFWCNEVISNFGQNYIRPIILIILLSIIFSIFKYIKDINLIYKLSPKLNDYILPIQQFLNNLAINIIPFNKFLIEGMEFISLIYYLINSILIWQTIVALKRYTKR